MALNITFRQLKVFESAARRLSYTRAAEELHLSQPGVSMQIKQLEEMVGLPLFEQIGKKMHLTHAGEEVYSYSLSIGQMLDEMETVLNELKGLHSGRLSISVATTASYFATRMLAEFSKRYQDITISLDITNRESLQRQLENNSPDLVIMGQPPAGVDVDADAFMENPLVIIASVEHELVGSRNIPLAEMAEERFVVREAGSGTRIAIARFFAEHNVSFHTGIEMSSNEAIKQAVEAGLGLGIVSLHTLELELETNRLVVLEVEDFPILRYWYIMQCKGKRLSPAAQVFRSFVLTQAKDFIQLPQ